MRRAGRGGERAARDSSSPPAPPAPPPLQQQLLPQRDPEGAGAGPRPDPRPLPNCGGRALPTRKGTTQVAASKQALGAKNERERKPQSREVGEPRPGLPRPPPACKMRPRLERGRGARVPPYLLSSQDRGSGRSRAARAPRSASVSRTQPSPLQGRRLHTHAHTPARPHAPRPRRGTWSCPPRRPPRRSVPAADPRRTCCQDAWRSRCRCSRPSAALLMAAAGARNLRDPRAAAAAAPGIPASLDNPKHKHNLLLRRLPAPGPGPPPRRRRPNSSHTRGRRLALTPPSAEILNRGAGRGAGGERGARGRGPQAPSRGGCRARRRPRPRHDRRRGKESRGPAARPGARTAAGRGETGRAARRGRGTRGEQGGRGFTSPRTE